MSFLGRGMLGALALASLMTLGGCIVVNKEIKGSGASAPADAPYWMEVIRTSNNAGLVIRMNKQTGEVWSGYYSGQAGVTHWNKLEEKR